MWKVTKLTDELLRRYLDLNMTDSEIAIRCGVSRSRVSAKRSELGLPPTVPQGARLKTKNDDAIIHMNKFGYSDTAIGKCLGVSPWVVQRARKRLGLVSYWDKAASPEAKAARREKIQTATIKRLAKKDPLCGHSVDDIVSLMYRERSYDEDPKAVPREPMWNWRKADYYSQPSSMMWAAE